MQSTKEKGISKKKRKRDGKEKPKKIENLILYTVYTCKQYEVYLDFLTQDLLNLQIYSPFHSNWLNLVKN